VSEAQRRNANTCYSGISTFLHLLEAFAIPVLISATLLLLVAYCNTLSLISWFSFSNFIKSSLDFDLCIELLLLIQGVSCPIQPFLYYQCGRELPASLTFFLVLALSRDIRRIKFAIVTSRSWPILQSQTKIVYRGKGACSIIREYSVHRASLDGEVGSYQDVATSVP
jgi:hypothetical protein